MEKQYIMLTVKDGDNMVRKSSDAQIRAQVKYAQNNVKQLLLALNKTTDADIIDWVFSMDNKQGYIKELIRADMKARKGE